MKHGLRTALRITPIRLSACLLTFAGVLLLVGCAKERSVRDAAHLYARWFVRPTQARTDSLQQLDLLQLREAVTYALEETAGAPGPGAVRLVDPSGTEYTIGYTAPATMQPGARYPLIIYLHGGIGGASDTKGERAYEMLLPLADSLPLLLASPTATRAAPWWSADGLARILQTLRYMSLHYPVDSARVILAGVSDGATGCYAAANAMCSPFAGFIAISGFGGMLPSLGMPLAPGNLMQRPIYNVNGDKDHLYPARAVEQFLNELERQGVGILRTRYPEEGHGFDYREREYPRLVQLVRSWRRPAERKGIAWRILAGVPNRADNLVSWSTQADLSGLPAINAYWHNGRLVVTSLGIDGFTFVAPKAERPPVVVANNRAEERCRDVSSQVESQLEA
ncbi:MAG: hypothetical protein GF331_21255, partial [Chitinivibrionales bacterium]|nr:hypothetical protein [Chitinivibrionales bacterium]